MKLPGIFTRRRNRGDPSKTATARVRRRPSPGVRARLLVFTVGSGILVLGTTGWLAFRIAEDTALREIHARAATLATDTALDISERIAHLRVVARTIAAADTALGRTGSHDPDLMRGILEQIGQRELDFVNAYVFYEPQVIPGREYAVVWETRDEAAPDFSTKPFVPNIPGESTYDPSQPVYDYRNSPRYTAAQTAGDFVWTDLFRDVGGRAGNVIVIAGVEPLYDDSGRFVGIAGVDLQVGQIRTYVAGVKPTENGYALLLDSNGTILSHSRDKAVGTINRPILDLAAETGSDALRQLGALMLAGESGVISMTDPLTGEDVFAAYAPIAENGWSISLLIPRADLLGNVAGLSLSLLALIGAAIGALAGIGLLFSASFVRPLIQLTRTATRIADGDLQQVAVVERDDEIGTLAQVLNSMTAQTRSFVGTLEENVATRTAQLHGTAEVGRVAASILDPNLLMREIVNLISDRFGFYYVAIFTLDEHGGFAVLREASGEAGRLLKERGHRLEVAGHSMVGYATAQRKLRIALDVGKEAVRFANPLLPNTRSEIALPLIVGDRVLGALDVQSTQEAAFDEASAAALQAMSDQIAIALSNATSYTETQAEALRAHALYVASQHVSRLEADLNTNIEEMMRAVGDTLGFSQWWVVIFDERREWLIPLASTGKGPHKSIRAADQPDSPSIRSAIYGETHVINDPEHDPRMNNIPTDRRAMVKFLSVPLVSRGMPMGALTFGHAINLPDLAVRDLEIGKSLASLCMIAIENRNLFEQTQRALDEVDTVNRLLTGEAWAAFSRRLARSGAIWVDSSGRSEQRHYPEIGEALSTGKIVVRQAAEQGRVDVAVPVLLRGAPIGALRLVIAEHHWTSELAATLESIASHVAQAAENARLVDTAESRARRERALSESTDKIRRKADLERVLQTAAEELARHMSASRVAVHLNVEGEAGTGGNGRTG